MEFIPRYVSLVTFLAASVTAAASQDLVFRSTIDVVTVDATVLDRDGRPRADLTTEDFVVKVDERPRRLVSSQFISRPPAASRAPVPVLQHFTSNEANDIGRLVVVAVDDRHIRRTEGGAALRAAARFIDGLDPLDLVAVTSLSRAAVVEFSRDRVALKSAVERLTGHADPVFLQFNLGLLESLEIADGVRTRLADAVLRECGRSLIDYMSQARALDDAAARDACPEQLEQEARGIAQHARTQARLSISGLELLVASLKTLPGSKTVVLLSEGMVLEPRYFDLSGLAAAAKDARVAVYALQMEVPMFEAAQDRVSPTAQRDVQVRGDGLDRLAGSARGVMFRLVGSDPRPFERIASEISGYYLLAFEAVDADRDGQLHKIEVQVRKGGEVRSRTAFRMPVIRASPRTAEDDLVRLLRGPTTATELPLRVATYTYAEPDTSRLRVVVSGEAEVPRDVVTPLPQRKTPQGPASETLLGYVLTDATGVIVASGAERSTDGRQSFSTVLGPGSYMLRVAGIDALGREGLVERVFSAGLESSADVRTSDLMLAPEPPSSAEALRPFVDRASGDVAAAYLELYAPPAMLADLAIVIGIAREGSDVDLRTSAAKLRIGDDGIGVARARVALAGLPPGRYVATARIVAAGQPERRVVRPFSYGLN